VYDGTHGNFVFVGDRLHFYPFTSVVIVLGGEGQVPTDPADPNHGTFQVACALYRDGYDVHMYDEDVVDNTGAGEAFDEVLSAVNEREVTDIAIFGYSHGGGSTYDLAGRLLNQADIGVDFTSYVDAVQNDSDTDVDQETRRPPGSA
jgi:hypothetical protein